MKGKSKMNDENDRHVLWLHLICCGGPLLVIALISLAPALIAFVLTNKVWVLVAGVGMVAAVGTLVWWRRARRVARSAGGHQQIELARARQQ